MISSSKEREAGALLPESLPTSSSTTSKRKSILFTIIAFSLVLIFGYSPPLDLSRPPYPSILSHDGLETCAWNHLQQHVSLLDVSPISRDEFLQRQATLAAALDEADVDAFIAEPSASSTYFANISSSYHLSERPFLIIIDRKGRFSYLAPQFELNRIASLDMVYDSKTVIPWAEENSPYSTLQDVTGFKKIWLDEHARFMIASGLQSAGIKVSETPLHVRQLREVKSDAELAILRGINQYTVEVVRSLQKCIEVGLTQSTILSVAETLFAKAGRGNGFWALILLGDQAANPHGGSSGKTLKHGDFVLIDIGSTLHDYESDVTRTILPQKSTVSDELMHVWQTVYDAQTAAMSRMWENSTCASVDAAARKVIADAGYAEYFTHRLGHGLGLEGHEHPYLNGANGEKLKTGEVATNEPVSVTVQNSPFHILSRISAKRNPHREYT